MREPRSSEDRRSTQAYFMAGPSVLNNLPKSQSLSRRPPPPPPPHQRSLSCLYRGNDDVSPTHCFKFWFINSIFGLLGWEEDRGRDWAGRREGVEEGEGVEWKNGVTGKSALISPPPPSSYWSLPYHVPLRRILVS